MNPSRVLFAASEVYPFAKSGGLADVTYSLPRALGQAHEMCVVMPLYRFIDRSAFGILPLNRSFSVRMGVEEYPIELFGCTMAGVEYRFVYSPVLCEREFLYGPPESGYEDNAIRFGIFAYAIVELLRQEPFAIAHLNDWQSALAALLIDQEPQIAAKVLYTIHNLAYQGTFDPSMLEKLGIDPKFFTMDGLEFYGAINFMKAGIAYADTVTTVSPTYAKEIMGEAFGCGLEGFIRHHRAKLHGILNGIDNEHFAPESDSALSIPYRDLKGKAVNKSALLKECALKGTKKPLFVFIGRFTWQKGMDILIQNLEKIALYECNIVILGDGEKEYHDALALIAKQHANIALSFGYDEAFAHRVYAAADFLLMPSLYEPCGLNQLIAMRYGALPLVHAVGGLADTVFAPKEETLLEGQGYGIVYHRSSDRAFMSAFGRAIELFGDKKRYSAIAKHNMRCDFSWNESAKIYSALYETLIG
ncbi:MAG: glycogen/starch synthase [Sulfuricurvum sp.]|uniref:glycogen synthase n=1 Tax=Sulfuricurvum sp. TaxID=2025608 RepID=UPI0035623C38